MQNDRAQKISNNFNRTVELPDGRQLGFLSIGNGKPLFYFHGTASSRLEILILKDFVENNKFKIVSFDRPGYGLSSFIHRRKLEDTNDDVNFLADHLNIRKFTILSWSGGGPFALSFAAHCSQRATKIIVVGSPSLPFDVSKAHNNNPLASLAMKIPHVGKWILRMVKDSTLMANRDIEAFIKSNRGKRMLSEWPTADVKFFSDPNWLKLMYASMEEGFRQGDSSIESIFEEHRLFMKPWKESLSQIPPKKLVIWQGAKDRTCPVQNAYRIAAAIPGAQVKIFSGEGHCVMFNRLNELKDELNNPASDRRSD